jgi:ribosomal protein S18 acetylase RimI-like enzyme
VDPADVESLERATLASVAPDEVHELGGFLVGIDGGTLGRARSAVSLRHDVEADDATLDAIEALYRERGRQPVFRVADTSGQDVLKAALARRGYSSDTPTLVMIGDLSGLKALSEPRAQAAAQPDGAWTAVFMGEGFDPVDGANRIRNLSRSPGAVFASVREGPQALAVGVGALGHGWLSIHGMRTHPARRGQGLAGQILSTLAHEAQGRGADRAFLQVMEDNAPARALYARAGFTPAWRYRYWSRPTSPVP